MDTLQIPVPDITRPVAEPELSAQARWIRTIAATEVVPCCTNPRNSAAA